MSAQERGDLIDKFNRDEEIFIFILSTRAGSYTGNVSLVVPVMSTRQINMVCVFTISNTGGLGINLTAANTVSYDTYMNKVCKVWC